jgi:cyclophilin family peptidyl-prolyl cis-trans isomerase
MVFPGVSSRGREIKVHRLIPKIMVQTSSPPIAEQTGKGKNRKSLDDFNDVCNLSTCHGPDTRVYFAQATVTSHPVKDHSTAVAA